jgi:hypothetical protein
MQKSFLNFDIELNFPDHSYFIDIDAYEDITTKEQDLFTFVLFGTVYEGSFRPVTSINYAKDIYNLTLQVIKEQEYNVKMLVKVKDKGITKYLICAKNELNTLLKLYFVKNNKLFCFGAKLNKEAKIINDEIKNLTQFKQLIKLANSIK